MACFNDSHIQQFSGDTVSTFTSTFCCAHELLWRVGNPLRRTPADKRPHFLLQHTILLQYCISIWVVLYMGCIHPSHNVLLCNASATPKQTHRFGSVSFHPFHFIPSQNLSYFLQRARTKLASQHGAQQLRGQ